MSGLEYGSVMTGMESMLQLRIFCHRSSGTVQSEKEKYIMKKKVLSMLLALTLVFALGGCAGGGNSSNTTGDNATAEDNKQDTAGDTSDDASADVMSYDEYMAADVDTEVTVEAYVQATQSWWEDKATIYAQDHDGGYFFYDTACSEEDYDKLVPGTKIRVTGYKTEWSGEVEIQEGTFEFVNDGDTYIADPTDVTEYLGIDEIENYQNQFVSFKGMKVEASKDADGNDAAFLYNYDGSGTDGDDLYFNASYNGQTYTFTIESYLCDSSTEVYAAVKNLQIGQTIDMEGFLYWYEGVNPHITSVTVVQ